MSLKESQNVGVRLLAVQNAYHAAKAEERITEVPSLTPEQYDRMMAVNSVTTSMLQIPRLNGYISRVQGQRRSTLLAHNTDPHKIVGVSTRDGMKYGEQQRATPIALARFDAILDDLVNEHERLIIRTINSCAS